MSFLDSLFGYRLRCEDCGKRFRPNLEDVPLPRGRFRREFHCPHCGRVYPVAVIDSDGTVTRP